MTSKYLKCDKCGTTLGAEAVIKHRAPTQHDTAELIRSARALGWVSRPISAPFRYGESYDLCPACNLPAGRSEG